MMNKVKTARLHLVKFLFILPLLIIVLAAFRSLPAVAADGAGAPVMVVADKADGRIPAEVSLADVAGGAGNKNKNEVAAMIRAVKERMITVALASTGAMKPRTDTVPKGIAEVTVVGRPMTPNMPKAMILVDGVVMPEDFDLNSIPANDIASVNVLKDESATRIFGAKGANGVIAIITKKAAAALPAKPAAARDKNEPITVVGRPSPAKSAGTSGKASVPVIESDKAITLVTTDTTKIAIKPGEGSNVVYYVNGIEVTKEQMKAINPNDIASINVIKDAGAVKKYGDKGKDGVIKITMKDADWKPGK